MTRNEKSGAAGPPVTGTSANMLFRKAGPGDCAQAQEIIRLARERMGRQGNPQWQDGYESSNHYFYVPQDLLEKQINVRFVLDGIEEQRRNLSH